MHFLLTLAVVAALVMSENCPGEPVSGAGYRLLAAIAGMVLVPAFAAVVSAGTAQQLRENSLRQQTLLRQFRRLRKVHAALWLAVAAGIVFGLGWPRLVRVNWHLEHTFLIDDLLVLAPVLLPLVLSWVAFYEVDRQVRAASSAEEAAAAAPLSRGAYVAVHVRHYLAILLAPVLTLLAVQDAVDLLIPGYRRAGTELAIYAPTIALLIVLFPLFLSGIWETRPLPAGELRDRLERVARRAGLQVRGILVWNTGGLVINAAVAGILPGLRYVFLSDGLLNNLSHDEVQAVFGHEVGHIRHRHLLLRGAALLAPLSLWLTVQQAAPQAADWAGNWLVAGGLFLQVPTAGIVLAAMTLYMWLVFGPFCRLLEGQADLFSCRLLAAEPAAQPVETFISALENLAGCSGVDRKAATWQHASIARRVDFLTRVAAKPEGERRFRRRILVLKALLIAVLAGPVLYHVLALR